MDLKECISAAEFANVCGVTHTTIERWRRLGIGPAPVKVGYRYFYSEAEVLSFAAERLAQKQEPKKAEPKIRNRVLVADSPKLRQKLSSGIAKANARGCVGIVDARDIAAKLGYAALNKLDAVGVDLLLAEMDKIAAQRPRPPEQEFWRCNKSQRVGKAGAI